MRGSSSHSARDVYKTPKLQSPTRIAITAATKKAMRALVDSSRALPISPAPDAKESIPKLTMKSTTPMTCLELSDSAEREPD